MDKGVTRQFSDSFPRVTVSWAEVPHRRGLDRGGVCGSSVIGQPRSKQNPPWGESFSVGNVRATMKLQRRSLVFRVPKKMGFMCFSRMKFGTLAEQH